MSKAAVFRGVGQPFELRGFEPPVRIEPGGALCRVRMATICGSDLHTISGRREEPTPLILGHEVVGEVVALGAGMDTDGRGDPVAVGDRVSWSIAASCRSCFYCDRNLPQKCVALRKYGHLCCEDPVALTGGFAEHIYIFPGTTLFRVKPVLSDAIVAPANCALATVVNALDTVGLTAGERVFIQGAGMLGLNLCALVREAGAREIIVSDTNARRLEMAIRFGADHTLDISETSSDERFRIIRSLTDDHGVDVAFEVCGAQSAVSEAIAALRIGGRYVVTMVTPGNEIILDGNVLARKSLQISGVHNYRPDHLDRGLRFLESYAQRYPYDELVGATFALEQINEAVVAAASGDFLRVGIVATVL